MPYANIADRKAFWDRHYAENAERYRARARIQRLEPGHSDYIRPIQRRIHLKTRYGITDADYFDMLSKQNGKCAICGSTSSGHGKSTLFDVDHCHATKKVRGLLCRNCNVTVGVVEGKRELIKKIHVYLAAHNVEYDPK